jgi:twitching motility protein PilT
MVSTARIRECIEDKEKTKEISDAIGKGYITYGMQTFDQSLMSLMQKGLISYEEALRHASNPEDFALKVRGVTATSEAGWKDFAEGKGERKAPPPDIERF